MQKLVYHDVRSAFGLTAQVVMRTISKVTDAYKLDKKTKRTFRPLGSIAYDARILSFNLDKNEVNLWTVDGRQKMPFVCHPRAKELLSGRRGESDLCLLDGEFYLLTSGEVDEPAPGDVVEFLGVDLGIKNIASDSDGRQYRGGHVNRLRARLQSKQSKSAKRLLRSRKRKEQRFARDVNHQIANEIVLRAKDTAPSRQPGVALEELGGIRKRVTVRKAERRQHHSWAFSDLRLKIEYQARLHGVPVILVDPRNTSRAGSVCGCVDTANRKDPATFLWRSCGHFANADTNAARVISGRAAFVNQPLVAALSLRGVSEGQAPGLQPQ